ncbi:MAG: aldo/keto reductase [Dehalococcoidales bacterium]|nr:aldo/keto reductase [Dehalococcoidales bacterium]
MSCRSVLRQTTEEHNRKPAQLTLARALNNRIAAAICGATLLEQSKQNVAAAELELSQEELDAGDGVRHRLRPPTFFYGR